MVCAVKPDGSPIIMAPEAPPPNVNKSGWIGIFTQFSKSNPWEIVWAGFTTTVIVVIIAHSEGLGVNVYVVVAVLLIFGLHVPLILFVEIEGRLIGWPLQIGAIWLKVGVIAALTFIVVNATSEHPAVLDAFNIAV